MKKICFTLSIIILFASFSFYGYAAVDLPTLQANMTEPEVFIKTENNKKTIQFYQVRKVNDPNLDTYTVTVWTAEALANADFYIMQFNNTYQSITCTMEFSWKMERYNIETGELTNQNTGISTLGSSESWALCYPPNHLYYIGLNMGTYITVAWYNIFPEGLNNGGTSSGQLDSTYRSNEFVNWKPATPDPVVYKSYMSEPISDPLNKYVILAGENGSYLYWINIRCKDFEMLSYSWDIETDDPALSDFVSYNEVIKAESLFTPTLKFIASGQSILSIECNQQLLDWYFQIPSLQSTTTGFIAFECLISKYDLLTGEFLASSYNSDCVMESQYTDIDATSFFGNASDYDSICVYGVNYLNQSEAIINRLACNWGIDPDFETWKTSVLNYLDLIYKELSGDGIQYTTETPDQSDISDAQEALNNLKVTDNQGNEITPDVAASRSFGEAMAAMTELQQPIVQINSLMNELIFTHPVIFAPVLLALALGLLVTILGKNKSD